MIAVERHAIADAVLAVAALGPVLPVRAGGKDPLTVNGVHGATRDPAAILRMIRRFPGCNWGVATGVVADVVDIDDLQVAGRLVADFMKLGGPCVATARGRHFYFRATTGATVKIAGGEIRRRGAYVVCPPSVHATGKSYIFTTPPTAPLPTLPSAIVEAIAISSAGSGDHRAPVGRVPHGQRHGYLVDFAVRLARAGVLDERVLLDHVVLEYQHRCEPYPLPARGSLEGIARWAVHTRIAERERRYR